MKGSLYDIGKFPENTRQLARVRGWVNGNSVWAVEEDGLLVLLGTDKPVTQTELEGQMEPPWFYPAIILIHGRQYLVEGAPSEEQDGSDLDFYREIVAPARNFEEKDKATCRAVSIIHDHFVLQLLNWNYGGGSQWQKSERRHRIHLAKYTACRIWREGDDQ